MLPYHISTSGVQLIGKGRPDVEGMKYKLGDRSKHCFGTS